MLSLRYIYRLVEAFFKKFKALIAIGVLLGLLVFFALYFVLPKAISKHERIGLVGRYSTNDLSLNILSQLSMGLTKVEIDGSITPGIAKSWETADGGKSWTFVLNNNLFWQDGKKLTAYDLNYNFNDAKFEVVNENEVKFSLDNEFSAFPVVVSKPVFKKGLLGVGEWKVGQISLTGGFVQRLMIAHKNSEKITYKFYPSDERLKLAFKLGHVDTVSKLQDIDEFKNWPKIKIEREVGYNNFIGLFINTESEKFKEKEARQAIAYSLKKDFPETERAISPISPFSWAYNPQVKPYNLDLEKAKKIKDMDIKIKTLPNLLKIAESIKSDLLEAGAKAEIEVVTVVPQEFDLFLATVDIPKDPDQYSLWHSTQTGTNISKFKNPRIDKLLEDGRKELDQETRKKIYLDFQRFLVEEVPAVFLYHPNFYTVRR